MIDASQLSTDLSTAVGAAIDVEQKGSAEAQIHTPFRFEDGDELVIRLREQRDGELEWTDTGHTFMHLSYWMDIEALDSGNRSRLLADHLAQFGADEQNGELIMPAGSEPGYSLLQFAQLLLHISDLDFLSREVVTSTFMDDFRDLMRKEFGDYAQLDYIDSERDPSGTIRSTACSTIARAPWRYSLCRTTIDVEMRRSPCINFVSGVASFSPRECSKIKRRSIAKSLPVLRTLATSSFRRWPEMSNQSLSTCVVSCSANHAASG